MAEQPTLKQRLNSLFSNPETKVTLKELLQTVPDNSERSSWRIFFALCSMMSQLEQGTKEYQEGEDYYWRYVNSGRCVRNLLDFLRCLRTGNRVSTLRVVEIDGAASKPMWYSECRTMTAAHLYDKEKQD
jgi:hypothetical protein